MCISKKERKMLENHLGLTDPYKHRDALKIDREGSVTYREARPNGYGRISAGHVTDLLRDARGDIAAQDDIKEIAFGECV